MLPKQYHPHDKKWLVEQISSLPVAYRSMASQGYEAVYRDEMAAGGLPHRVENRARFAANSRLMNYVSAVLNKSTNN